MLSKFAPFSLYREVTETKLHIARNEAFACKNTLQEMVYAKTQDEYNVAYKNLKDSGVTAAIVYFDTNWHHIREQWADCFKLSSFNLGQRTNNRLESLNQKLKAVIAKFSGVTEFFQNLMKVLNSIYTDHRHESLKLIQKRSVRVYPLKVVSLLADVLTPYAMELVEKQATLSPRTTIAAWVSETSATFATHTGMLVAESDKCRCHFFMSMRLPCRHMIRLWQEKGMEDINASQYDKRWTKAHFLKFHEDLTSIDAHGPQTSSSSASVTIMQQQANPVKSYTSQEMYRKSMDWGKRIAGICAQMSQENFTHVLENFHDLYDILSRSKQALILELQEDGM